MTDTFDWAGLAGSVVLANAGQGPDAAIAILQREIEAAFVPVEQRDKAEALLYQRTNEYIQAAARAEAAEVRVKMLEEALRDIAKEADQSGINEYARCDACSQMELIARQALGADGA